MAMVKSNEKKMSKLFSYDYEHYNVVKRRRDLNFERMEKMMGFDYCEEYLRSTSNKILLRQC